MAFTDHSDLFGSVHEDGINFFIRHLMRQRPALFNYATPIFHERPSLFCEKIDAAQSVIDEGNPLFTEQAALPILGTPVPIGINFCVQFTHAEVDFHPGNFFDLPPELRTLPEQHFSLRARACAGLDCPSSKVIEELIPSIEGFLLAREELAVGKVDEDKKDNKRGETPIASTGASTVKNRNVLAIRGESMAVNQDLQAVKGRDDFVLPTEKLLCFCLELFAVGHFEWGSVPGSKQQWLKTRLDGIEIVDLQPTPMENAIECYAATVLRLGILPRLIIPMSKMVLDITGLLKKEGLELGQQVQLEPATVPGDVPNNPAVEEDTLKVFVNLTVTEGGS